MSPTPKEPTEVREKHTWITRTLVWGGSGYIVSNRKFPPKRDKRAPARVGTEILRIKTHPSGGWLDLKNTGLIWERKQIVRLKMDFGKPTAVGGKHSSRG